MTNEGGLGESPSTRRAWIEITIIKSKLELLKSPSTRRAWIEIGPVKNNPKRGDVALHPEGVDRNKAELSVVPFLRVALHPEGVDRNFVGGQVGAGKTRRPPPGGRG